MHVELDAICPELDGALERRDRILRVGLMRPTVGDALGWIAALSCGQAFLAVVALYSMSAKL
ncbi:MAG TPA: hypothetical protein VFH13_06655 [Gemmatimonadaceae bacterium]|nr:hypothetical protein [Gemmatimonadaceae bacterium]